MRGAAVFVLGLCWTTTVLAQTTPAPPAAAFALPVTGGTEVLDRLGFGPADRGVALVLLARALHGAGGSGATGSLGITITELFGSAAEPAGLADGEGERAAVLAPFNDRLWRRLLVLDARTDVFAAIVRSRSALLLASGALQAEPAVREWLQEEPRLLVDIMRESSGSFALAGPALTLARGRIVVPGGADAEPGWTALVGVPPSRPGDFLRRLLSRNQGHLARFFTNLARLDDETRTALLRPVGSDDASRALTTLYELAREAEAPWEPNRHPYQLSYADLPAILLSLRDLDAGALPSSAGWWPALLGTRVDSRDDAVALLRRPPAPQAFAATIRRLLNGSPRKRRAQVAVIALARRMWDGAAPPDTQADSVYALGQFERFRGLLLALDRMDVLTPGTWARAVDAAQIVDRGNAGERARRLSIFQGAIALVERARLAGSLSAEAADGVIAPLVNTVADGTAVEDAVRSWTTETFTRALPPLVRPDRFSGTTAYESRILQALAGPPVESPPALSWEGLSYVVDVQGAELDRIQQIRALLPSPGLDAALASGDASALAEALRALAYAPALGDPDGGVALGPDVATRHDFGIGSRSAGHEFAWGPAQEQTGSGEPWHVAGSLFGLDVALARSALRRLANDEMPAVPTVNLNDQLTLTRTAVAIRTRDMDDRVRDELAAAIGRGRARVAAAGSDAEALLALGREAALTVADRRTLAWTLGHAPDAGATLFSLRDLLWLGRPRLTSAELAPWGVLGETVDGRLVTRFDRPAPWDELAGRPDTGVLATQVPDLTLRLAQATAERRLPAVLVPELLAYATQDYWHEVDARFSEDWPAMVQGAITMSDERIEDYVAALAGHGPLRPQ